MMMAHKKTDTFQRKDIQAQKTRVAIIGIYLISVSCCQKNRPVFVLVLSAMEAAVMKNCEDMFGNGSTKQTNYTEHRLQSKSFQQLLNLIRAILHDQGLPIYIQSLASVSIMKLL